MFGRRLNPAKHPARRPRRRIADANAGAISDVLRLHINVLQVVSARADILACDEATAESFDKASVSAKHALAFARLVVTNDHCLAATKRDACQCALVSHGA